MTFDEAMAAVSIKIEAADFTDKLARLGQYLRLLLIHSLAIPLASHVRSFQHSTFWELVVFGGAVRNPSGICRDHR
jgi:hypothetical protein